MKNRSLFLLTFICLLFIACTAPEHSFSAEELKIIDSLYTIEKDTVELIMAEECDSMYLEVYETIVDSIKTVRKREILDIIQE